MNMTYTIHHAQVTVRDIEASEQFYDILFTALGFDITKKYKGYLAHADMSVVEYLSENFDFGICSPKQAFINDEINSRKPGALQHIAFRADSPDAVDAIFAAIKHLDITILHNEPREYTKIAPNYYALFFEDIDGIRWEVFHHSE